jgi:hypothetical protein
MSKALPKKISATIERERDNDFISASFDPTGEGLAVGGEIVRVGIYVLEEEVDIRLVPMSKPVSRRK